MLTDSVQRMGAADADSAQAIYEEALQAFGAQEFARAVELFDHVILLDPARAEPYYKRGNALRKLQRLPEAVASYDQAILRNPGFAYAYCNRGVAQQALGMNDEALASYESAIAQDPQDAMSHYNRAVLLQEYSRWDEAVASYDRAVAIDPTFADAQYNRSLALLYCGRLAEGWRGYEWRWRNAARLGMGEPRDFPQPLWLGQETLEGKRLLLHSEGGMGDTLQFSRYAALAAQCGATVYLEVQPALREILSKLEGVAAIINKGDALPRFDYHCPLMSLPLAFNTDLDSVPPPAKPLQVDVTKRERWQALSDKARGPRIGLVWSGNPNNPNDHRRSVRLYDWAAWLPAGYCYFRLQKDMKEEDAGVMASYGINSTDEDVQDFAHIGALCQCMDLVISVDTSIAHLSASLGLPTWIMLPHIPDWRWLRGRQDSPWYPTMRLFRQEHPAGWQRVFEQIADRLRRQFPVA